MPELGQRTQLDAAVSEADQRERLLHEIELYRTTCLTQMAALVANEGRFVREYMDDCLTSITTPRSGRGYDAHISLLTKYIRKEDMRRPPGGDREKQQTLLQHLIPTVLSEVARETMRAGRGQEMDAETGTVIELDDATATSHIDRCIQAAHLVWLTNHHATEMICDEQIQAGVQLIRNAVGTISLSQLLAVLQTGAARYPGPEGDQQKKIPRGRHDRLGTQAAVATLDWLAQRLTDNHPDQAQVEAILRADHPILLQLAADVTAQCDVHNVRGDTGRLPEILSPTICGLLYDALQSSQPNWTQDVLGLARNGYRIAQAIVTRLNLTKPYVPKNLTSPRAQPAAPPIGAAITFLNPDDTFLID